MAMEKRVGETRRGRDGMKDRCRTGWVDGLGMRGAEMRRLTLQDVSGVVVRD